MLEEPTPHSPFLLLPPETKLKIFALLGAPDLGHAALVCREWRTLSEDDSLWRPILDQKASTVDPAILSKDKQWTELQKQDPPPGAKAQFIALLDAETRVRAPQTWLKRKKLEWQLKWLAGNRYLAAIGERGPRVIQLIIAYPTLLAFVFFFLLLFLRLEGVLPPTTSWHIVLLPLDALLALWTLCLATVLFASFNARPTFLTWLEHPDQTCNWEGVVLSLFVEIVMVGLLVFTILLGFKLDGVIKSYYVAWIPLWGITISHALWSYLFHRKILWSKDAVQRDNIDALYGYVFMFILIHGAFMSLHATILFKLTGILEASWYDALVPVYLVFGTAMAVGLIGGIILLVSLIRAGGSCRPAPAAAAEAGTAASDTSATIRFNMLPGALMGVLVPTPLVVWTAMISRKIEAELDMPYWEIFIPMFLAMAIFITACGMLRFDHKQTNNKQACALQNSADTTKPEAADGDEPQPAQQSPQEAG